MPRLTRKQFKNLFVNWQKHSTPSWAGKETNYIWIDGFGNEYILEFYSQDAIFFKIDAITKEQTRINVFSMGAMGESRKDSFLYNVYASVLEHFLSKHVD